MITANESTYTPPPAVVWVNTTSQPFLEESRIAYP
jgi:hypothetical protein